MSYPEAEERKGGEMKERNIPAFGREGGTTGRRSNVPLPPL